MSAAPQIEMAALDGPSLPPKPTDPLGRPVKWILVTGAPGFHYEGQFFEVGDSPHGCWIGLNDNFQERHLSWTDGSVVNFQAWAPGEPNSNGNSATQEDVVEMDFRLIGRCTGSAYAANQNNGCQTTDFRNGEWNDNQNGGDGGSMGAYPLCQTAAFQNPLTHDYVGCYTDSPDRDMQGMQEQFDHEFFDMGENGTPDTCATLCAGFAYFGLQYGNQCCKIVMLSRFVALSVSLTQRSSLSQSATTPTR